MSHQFERVPVDVLRVAMQEATKSMGSGFMSARTGISVPGLSIFVAGTMKPRWKTLWLIEEWYLHRRGKDPRAFAIWKKEKEKLRRMKKRHKKLRYEDRDRGASRWDLERRIEKLPYSLQRRMAR